MPQISVLSVSVILSLAYLWWDPLPPPKQLVIHPSISASSDVQNELQKRFKELYPEEYYQGGAYAALPYGKTRYYLLGPDDAPKVVLVCGFALPSPVMSSMLQYLTQHFRVLMYDYYGRGYSEAPETEYTTDLYITQLALLMQHVGWPKAHIVGVSMGGAIAAALGAAFPNLILGKIALISPAGLLTSAHIPLRGKVLASPLMQHLISFPAFRSILTRKPIKVSTTTSLKTSDLVELALLQQKVLPYHLSALASTLRHGPTRGQESAYTTIGGNSAISTLIFWGTDDDVVPYNLAPDMVKRLRLPAENLVTIPGGTHDISVSHAAEIGPRLRDFLLA